MTPGTLHDAPSGDPRGREPGRALFFAATVAAAVLIPLLALALLGLMTLAAQEQMHWGNSTRHTGYLVALVGLPWVRAHFLAGRCANRLAFSLAPIAGMGVGALLAGWIVAMSSPEVRPWPVLLLGPPLWALFETSAVRGAPRSHVVFFAWTVVAALVSIGGAVLLFRGGAPSVTAILLVLVGVAVTFGFCQSRALAWMAEHEPLGETPTTSPVPEVFD